MQLPSKWQQRMQMMLGDEYESLVACYSKPRHHALRIHPSRCSIEALQEATGWALRPIAWETNGYYYEETVRAGKHPYHEAGAYYIQEASAMASVSLGQAKPQERILDLCAAPGGKSTHIASAMQQGGLLVCNEIHPLRAKALSSNIERMGIRHALVTNETPKRLADRWEGYFDRVYVDAPCSGEGMFRKEPQALEQWSPTKVAGCAMMQQEILEQADRLLRDGGRLVYSTCTFAPEENEGTIAAFLNSHPNYTIVDADENGWFDHGQPQWIGSQNECLCKTSRLWPHHLEGEGHFVAVLQKHGYADPKPIRPMITPVDRRMQVAWQQFASETLQVVPSGSLRAFGDVLSLVPFGMDTAGLKVLRAGLQLGTCKKDRIEPAHALALSLHPADVKRVLRLTLDDPRMYAYLHGDSFACDLDKGWCAVAVDDLIVGWGKVSNGILKNHYPKGLRWM